MTKPLKIGVVTNLVGPFKGMGEDGVRGVKLASQEFGGQVADRKIEFLVESSNAIPDTAINRADYLLQQKGVDFIVGPLSGNEGWAMRDYAKTQPHKTFINGQAGGQEMTLRDPAPNFFNFLTNGVQWVAGLAEYAYHTLGYRRIATIGEDYSFPHAQIGGFTLQFCRLGGRIVKQLWVPLGTSTYGEVLTSLPDDIDALFAPLGGTDAVNFFAQYQGKTPLIGGTVTADQAVLQECQPFGERLVGMLSGGPKCDDNPNAAWGQFVGAYRERYPDGYLFPSLGAYGYYLGTKAALLAIQHLEGDLGTEQADFQHVLSHLEFETPSGGAVRLNHNRHAIANNFISVTDRDEEGRLFNRLVQVVPAVDQTLGIPEAEYLEIGMFTRDNPPLCAD